jgi:hypothetical protein
MDRRDVYDPLVDLEYWSLSMTPMDGGAGSTRMRESEILPWIRSRNERGIIVAIKSCNRVPMSSFGRAKGSFMEFSE